MKLSPPTKGLLLSLLGFAAFSISDAFSKLLTGRLNPFEVAFSGGVFGLLLVPFVKTRGQSWLNILPIQKPGMWWIRAVATFIATAASCRILHASVHAGSTLAHVPDALYRHYSFCGGS